MACDRVSVKEEEKSAEVCVQQMRRNTPFATQRRDRVLLFI